MKKNNSVRNIVLLALLIAVQVVLANVNIPMPGDAESLNVAQAATVILFEYVRRMF